MTGDEEKRAENIAPLGKEWLCMACGKRQKDFYGSESSSWDESCMMNCILVDEGFPPTVEQGNKFRDERASYLQRSKDSIADLIHRMKNGLPLPGEDDPELDAAAKDAVMRIEARKNV